jgi:hypothetical protein
MADKQTNSLSGNDEGDADKGTDTAQLESNAPQRADVYDTGIIEGHGPREDRTLRGIFDRDKSVALDCAEQLSEMIPELQLDGLFGDDVATDDKRPMPTLVLAKELCAALENIECIKMIMEKEQYYE